MLESLPEKITKEKAALVVVDMQNDFCHPDGISAKNGGDVSSSVAMAPRLVALIDDARATGVPVIFIQCVHNQWTTSEVRMERRRNRLDPGTCWEGTWGAEFYAVEPLPGECIVIKHRFSAFIGTDLDLILRAQGIETIIMTGVGTNVCVESTSRDGFMLDYYLVFVGDCTATTSGPEFHDHTVSSMTRWGDVVNAADLSAIWAAQRASEPAAAAV